MGIFFGVVGGHVTDQMSFASSRPTQSPPTTDDAIANDDGGRDDNVRGSCSSRAFAFVVLRK
jgi:hypothetical protein